MKEKVKTFLDILFDQEETVCVSNNKYATESIKLSELNSEIITTFGRKQEQRTDVSFNSNDIQLIAINPIIGIRNDANVQKYRNFLIELDVGTLEEQLQYVTDSKLPFSACVFSGNKSLHFIVSLKKELINKDAYDYAYKWMLNILDKADKQVCSPSRGVRYPEVLRKETGKYQSAILLNDRINNDLFYSWLHSYQDKRPKPRVIRDVNPPTEATFDLLSDKLKEQLVDNKIDFSEGRNVTWFKIAIEFARSGFSEDNAVEILSRYYDEESTFKQREWLTCIKSGYRRIHG